MKPISEILYNYPELSYLFNNDYDQLYSYSEDLSGKNTTNIQKCILVQNKYDFMNDYIKNYLKEFPYTINFENNLGMNALMLACMNVNKTCNIETVKILLDSHPDIDHMDKEENNALMYALKYCSDEFNLIKLLLDYKFNVNTMNIHGNNSLLILCCNHKVNEKTFDMIVRKTENLNHRNIYGNNFLMLMLSMNSIQDIKFFKKVLDLPINIDALNCEDMSILDIILIHFQNNLLKDQMIEILLQKDIIISEEINHVPLPKVLHYLYFKNKISIDSIKLISQYCSKLNCVENDSIINIIYNENLTINRKETENKCNQLSKKIFSCFILYFAMVMFNIRSF